MYFQAIQPEKIHDACMARVQLPPKLCACNLENVEIVFELLIFYLPQRYKLSILARTILYQQLGRTFDESPPLTLLPTVPRLEQQHLNQ